MLLDGMRSSLGTAGAVLIVVAALGAVLTTDEGASRARRVHRFGAKLNSQDLAGNYGEPAGDEKPGENPIGSEEQNYFAHAYPASELSMMLTLNAQSAWKLVKNRSSKGKNTLGQWTLAGPSSANYPDVLTFSGASYTA